MATVHLRSRQESFPHTFKRPNPAAETGRQSGNHLPCGSRRDCVLPKPRSAPVPGRCNVKPINISRFSTPFPTQPALYHWLWPLGNPPVRRTICRCKRSALRSPHTDGLPKRKPEINGTDRHEMDADFCFQRCCARGRAHSGGWATRITSSSALFTSCPCRSGAVGARWRATDRLPMGILRGRPSMWLLLKGLRSLNNCSRIR